MLRVLIICPYHACHPPIIKCTYNFLSLPRYCIDTVNFDRFSDPDSLSFNSLSRSSSLIQFESLERQIQTGEQQSFGGSTPSLNNANAMSVESKASEHAAPLHAARNYFDIEKIDFTSALYLNCQEQTSSSESSCSTDNSIYYSDQQPEVEGTGAKEAQRSQRTQTAKVAFRRKNSVENLSEDSGYGDLPSFKCRSKSIPNLNNDHQLLVGIAEPLDNHRSLNDISRRSPCKAPEMPSDIQRDCQNAFGVASGRPKINAIHATSEQRSAEHASSATLDASKNSLNAENGWLNGNRSHVLSAAQPNRSVSARSADELSVQSRNSTSLPDIYAHFVSDYGNSVCSP